MGDDFEKILDQAEELTNAQLSSKIASLTRLKESEIDQLCPKKPDKETLVQLMGIVNGATSENQKKKQLVDNIETLAGVVIRVLAKAV